MPRHNTKFRLFSVLVLFGVVNLLLQVYWNRNNSNYVVAVISTVVTASLSSMGRSVVKYFKSNAPHTNGTVVTYAQGRSVVTRVQGVVLSNARYGNETVVTHVQDVLRSSGRHAESGASETLDSVKKLHWEGRAMEAWGKVVRPRANVAVPWSRGRNSSTLCPLIPPQLVGPLKTYTQAPSWTDIIHLNPELEPGGHYHPAQCRARHRVAVVIPYRDREEHLRLLLHNLHPMLIRQQLDYFILVVELAQLTTFNRGMLLNIGAVEAGGLWDVQCFIFHDVDLVPENDKNLYTCPDKPRHMSAAVNTFRYKLPYPGIMGGVTAFSREQFYKLNGYSNVYFGWGGEDDDISGRVRHARLTVTRYSMEIARYRMIRHSRDKNNAVNPMRFKMLKNVTGRQPIDGLNSLQYQVLKTEFRTTYTWMLVSIDEAKILDIVKNIAKEVEGPGAKKDKKQAKQPPQ